MTALPLPESPLPQPHHAAAGAGEQIERERGLYLAAQVCAAGLMLLGLVVLGGWLLGYVALTTVLPGHVSMKPNTAIGFVTAGAAVLFAVKDALSNQNGRNPRLLVWTRLFAATTAGNGALTLAEYIVHIDLHIDQAFFPDPVQWPYPGRMAHITAANFLLAGIAIFLLAGGRRARFTAQLLALLLVANAYAGMVGFLYGVPVLFGSLGYTAMAFHTGVGFLVLGFAILAAQPDSRLMQVLSASKPGSWLARRLLPILIVSPVALGWLYLQPAVSFGRPRFAMALFAVTLTAAGSAALWFTAAFLNRADAERSEIAQVRERSEAAVRQSERELRLVTDHLPILLSYLDVNSRFLRVNKTYEDWLGLPAGEIVGKTVRDLLGEDYWRLTQPVRDLAALGKTGTIETHYPTVRGDRRAQVTYAPDLAQDGEVRGIACMVVDMEDHRLAESALRQSEKLAVVGRLASSIAHEINNPLEAVTNLLYLLEQETAPQGVAHEYVMQAEQELARVTHIVVQTLRFHRQATQPTLCRLSDLVEQVLGLYGGRLNNAHIEVNARFRETEFVLCREGDLRQVLANLVGNAIDAMSGGGRLMIRTQTTTDCKTGLRGTSMIVADTGHGISRELLKKLFEPFHTTKGAKGSGLGLWISKEIVDRHEGLLRVRSSQGGAASGTAFRIFIPYRPAGQNAGGGDALRIDAPARAVEGQVAPEQRQTTFSNS